MNLFVTLRPACAAVLVAVVMGSAAAQAAVTITNRDDQDHTIMIIEGEKKTEHVLKPSQSLKDVCEKGCFLRIDDDDEDDPYQLQPGVAVSIEDGVLYYEPDPATPAQPGTPKQGSGTKGPNG